MIWLPVVGKWADIDVYASIIAYADLLNQRNKPAKAYIPTAPNYSIPDSLRIKESEYRVFDLQPTDQAIILDISIPEIIHEFVSDDQILELIDHHPGYEEYWKQRLGSKAIIEKIGAVATSIFEWWGECWDYEKMSPQIAKLLLAAILDNTLNFNADITTERDRQSADKLAQIIQTDLTDFTKWYFQTVSETIFSNLNEALANDTKTVEIPNTSTRFTFGQLTIWDANELLQNTTTIRSFMNQKYQNWMLSILNISEKRNYVLTNSQQLTEYFTKLLDLTKQGDFHASKKLFLRKEILAKMLATTAREQ